MAVTVAGFWALFGEFSTTPDTDVEWALARARPIFSVGDEGHYYCAAHLLAIRPEGTGAADGGSGVVVSETIGPKRVDYATQAGSGGDEGAWRVWFDRTSYGRHVLTLMDHNPRLVASALVVG